MRRFHCRARCDGPRSGSSLFAQGAAAVLGRNLADPELSWLLASRAGDVLAERWPHAEKVFAPGSLLKPFLAAAYGEQLGQGA